MHKSRLGALVIDCQAEDRAKFAAGAEFWSQALGYEAQTSADPEDENYVKLKTPASEVSILLQKVDHPSRVHLDIETDDVEAEVQRLERLGATRVAQVKRWWVMEAPSGQRFCVVPPQRADFADGANEWR